MRSCRLKPLLASLVIIGLFGDTNQARKCMKTEEDPTPDYCKEYGDKHVGCKVKEGPVKCGASKGEVYPLTAKDKRRIVKQHNVYRNMVAKGSFKLLPVAARMLKLKWDENLAFIADQAVRRCHMVLPKKLPLATAGSSVPSYNAAYNKYPEDVQQDEMKIVKAQIKAWFDQYRYVDVIALHSNTSRAGQEIRHFQRMMLGLNDRVGCGIVKFTENKFTFQLMICFYGCPRQGKKNTYELGKVPAEKCQCGSDKQFKNLCNKLERYGDCSIEGGASKQSSAPPTFKDMYTGITQWILNLFP